MAAGSGMPDHPGLAGAGLPASARVAIISGGICGASALYHLAPEHAEPGTALEVRVVGDLRPPGCSARPSMIQRTRVCAPS